MPDNTLDKAKEPSTSRPGVVSTTLRDLIVALQDAADATTDNQEEADRLVREALLDLTARLRSPAPESVARAMYLALEGVA